MKKIKVSVYKMIELDNYENGCQPDTCQDFGIIENKNFPTIELALDFIERNYGKPGIFEDRLEFQATENSDGFYPSENELNLFKSGKIDLYYVCYSFYFSELIENELDNEFLIKNFPELEQY